jgi:DNA-binding transcriptional LysR family regulator
MIPSLSEITHFIEIYQVRHISKAAMRLGITQPTLSQSLQRLEEKLQTTLFQRTKQGVVPTAAAALFYRRAQALHDCWSDVQAGLTENLQELQGSFILGCHQSVGAYTLPILLKRISEEAPKIEVKLTHEMSRRITEGIVSYEIDLGYVVNPPLHPDLVLRKIGDDRVTFWKKRGLTEIPKRIFGDGSREQIEDLLGQTFKKYFKGWSFVSTPSLELIRSLTSRGAGIGILPERVVQAEQSDLVVYDKQLPYRADKIYLAYRKETLTSHAARELIRLANFTL